MNTSITKAQEAPSWDKLHAMILATSEQMKETDRRLQEIYEQTERQMRDTDNKMKELQGLFTTQWGKLVEALCRPAALKLFQDKGIKIDQIYKEVHHDKYLENEMEVDAILCNTVEAVAVEVKTTCKINDVDYFMGKNTSERTQFVMENLREEIDMVAN